MQPQSIVVCHVRSSVMHCNPFVILAIANLVLWNHSRHIKYISVICSITFENVLSSLIRDHLLECQLWWMTWNLPINYSGYNMLSIYLGFSKSYIIGTNNRSFVTFQKFRHNHILSPHHLFVNIQYMYINRYLTF